MDSPLNQLKETLKLLSSQPALSPLFPHLLHFCYSRMLSLVKNKSLHDTIHHMLLLMTIESLLENPFFEMSETIRISSVVSALVGVLMSDGFGGPGAIHVKRMAA